MKNIVEAENLSKTYPLFKNKKDCLLAVLGRKYTDVFCALQDISFNLKPGDRLGLLGLNGAGKSTLLKILAGVLEYEGRVVVNGTKHAILEAGIGFDTHLTGVEAAKRLMMLYGVASKKIGGFLDEIFEFAELEEWRNRKLFTYSAGMKARLLFSILTSVPADVYIVDEFIAVGDEHFIGKSKKRFRKLAHIGKALVLASHDYEMVMRSCNKAIFLKKGKSFVQGKTFHVIKKFQKEYYSSLTPLKETPEGQMVHGDGSLTCSPLEIKVIQKDSAVDLVGGFNYTSYQDLEALIAVYVTRMSGVYVKTLVFTTSLSKGLKIDHGNGRVDFKLGDVPLGAGEYMCNFGVTSFHDSSKTHYAAGWAVDKEVYFKVEKPSRNGVYNKRLNWRRR